MHKQDTIQGKIDPTRKFILVIVTALPVVWVTNVVFLKAPELVGNLEVALAIGFLPFAPFFAITALLILCRPYAFQANPQGLTIVKNGRNRHHKWQDLGSFEVVNHGDNDFWLSAFYRNRELSLIANKKFAPAHTSNGDVNIPLSNEKALNNQEAAEALSKELSKMAEIYGHGPSKINRPAFKDKNFIANSGIKFAAGFALFVPVVIAAIVLWVYIMKTTLHADNPENIVQFIRNIATFSF